MSDPTEPPHLNDYNWWGVCLGCGREPGNGMDGRGEGGEEHDPQCPVAAKERQERQTGR